MKKIVIFTGAGMSKESGIDTFRDVDGLWEGHDVYKVANIQSWHKGKAEKELMLEFYNKRWEQLQTVQPNLGHNLLAVLEQDFEVVVVTQNVDDLHERAGSSEVIHLHGELQKACSSLDKTKTVPYPGPIKIGDKHEDGSQLRPFIVWFGEDVPLMRDAQRAIYGADYLIVIGTSLEVYPAASLIDYAVKTKNFLIDPKANEMEKTMRENGYGDEIDRWTFIAKGASEGVTELMKILLDERAV